MEKELTFSYSYSAKVNKEIQEIRNKYLPKGESKLDELKRLDNAVQTSGMSAALCVGIISVLVFGAGMCLAMNILGNGIFFAVLGVVIGVIGMVGMGMAYPIYRRIFNRTKEKLAPRILELAEELSGENINN
ncbi:MAG: hypothetical protein IJ017_05460 [Oscillospiraceae bacterium]|nr:hypothetical protein [Oscillospiraceae bacterium]